VFDRPRWSIAVAIALHGVPLAVLLRPTAPATAGPVIIIPDTSFPVEPATRTPGPIVLSPGPVGPVIVPIPVLVPITGIPPISAPSFGDPRTLGPFRGDSVTGSGTMWTAEALQEAPVLLTAPLPTYPARLREAGIQGQVVIEAIVDTLGRVEPGSMRVVASDQAEFDGPALVTIRGALFRPGRVFGKGVRVLVRVPVAFRLR
jgi:TonB family protein